MITLDQATADAFARREIRIEPILEVLEDVTNQVWRQVPSSLLLSRPARTSSPVISRTPVMRMDAEVAPTDEMKALFLEQRFIRYREIINGQTFDRFFGNIHALEKGWDASEGVLREHIKVAAYSRSQRLGSLDYEDIFKPSLSGPPAGQGVALGFMVYPQSEILEKAAAGNDYMSSQQAFCPNVVASNIYRAFVTKQDGTTVNAGTNFVIEVQGAYDLVVRWISSAPATGESYRLIFYKVKGWVVPGSPSYWTAATVSVPSAYYMQPIPLGEYDIPLVAQASYPRKGYLSPHQSHPSFWMRAGSGVGAPTEVGLVAAELGLFSVDWDRGCVQFNELGSSGKAYIFANQQYVAADIMFVGAKELYWPNEAAAVNQVEWRIELLYAAANVAVSLDATLVSLKDYRIEGKGDTILRTLLDNTAPNYIVHDAPDGYVRGKYMAQAGSAQFHLTQIQALRNIEMPEFYTMVRVKSAIDTDYSVKWKAADLIGFDTLPMFKSSVFPNYWKIVDGRGSTFSQPLTANLPQIIAFRPMGTTNYIEIPKTFTVKSEGELRFFKAQADVNIISGSAPVESARQYLPGYDRVIGPTGSPKDVTLNMGDYSQAAFGGQFVESICVELKTHTLAPNPKLYTVGGTVDRYVLGIACISDDTSLGLANGAWGTRSISGPGGYDSTMTVRIQKVDTPLLEQWMLNFKSANDPVTPKDFYWQWNRHRVLEIEEPSLNRDQAQALAEAYLTDILRRATAQEVDVLVEAAVEIGDTVAIFDPTTNTTVNRLVVGFRDGSSFENPALTLELADYT